MISPDSNLFREHPDWAIQIPDRTPSLARNQLVLDLSRPEIVDYIYEKVAKILRSANIEYVKWDMNRQLSDLGSYGLSPERQGELSHRYTLAVYEMQERLIYWRIVPAAEPDSMQECYIIVRRSGVPMIRTP